MKDFNPKWIKIAAAVLVILILVGFWIFRAIPASAPNQTGTDVPGNQSIVDRGMSDEQEQMFRDKIAEFEATAAKNEAEGTRDIGVILQLGNLYYTVGDLEIAASWYQNILNTNPEDAPALENFGQVQFEMGNFAAAETSWRKAVDSAANEQIYIKLADLIEDHFPERNADIQFILETAIANNGQTVGLLVRLGQWYADREMYDEAISHYQVAKQLDPGSQGITAEIESLKRLRSKQLSK